MEQNNLVFEVDGIIYELIYNFKDAFQKEWFEEKLVDVLKNKPYIVNIDCYIQHKFICWKIIKL